MLETRKNLFTANFISNQYKTKLELVLLESSSSLFRSFILQIFKLKKLFFTNYTLSITNLPIFPSRYSRKTMLITLLISGTPPLLRQPLF